jgi:DNA polymerase (family 10)
VTASSTLPRTLGELADLSEIRGRTATAAHLRRAASAIEGLSPLDAAAFGQALQQGRIVHPGISPEVHRHIRDISSGGAAVALIAARAGVPRLLRRVLELSLLSTSEAVTLLRQLGILTVEDLAMALDDGRVKSVMGDALEERLRSAPETLDAEAPAFTLGRAWALLDPVVAAIGEAWPGIDSLTPAGGVRRCEPLVPALVVVGRASDPAAAIDAICAVTGLNDVLHRGSRRAILLYQEAEVDVRITSADDYGTVLFRATGSRPHVAALHDRRPLPRLAAREEDVYTHVGLPFIAPELRHADGEIEAAAAKTLPALVDRSDIRGDLHMHTTYSDGRDTVATMVAACAALGYEYIAISDHSENAAASRTLTIEQLAQQADEIARLREQYPQMTILHGIEADILRDGRLDLPDALLETLDIVLASLHDPAGQDGRALTRRCIQAIRHPLANVITHPANQLVGRRPGYELDFEAIYAAAAETGTALEIDGAPSHLDLDGARAHAAVAVGVTVTIDSDCHRAGALDRQMRLGVGTARRGWVEARHVLNTRPIAEVRAFISSKRARLG